MLLMTAQVVVASIIALAGSGMTYEYIAEKLDERNVLPIGRMVDVGGYKLHMIEMGQNHEGPVVIMEAGGGACSLDWQLVQPEISKFARVITYDRAGYAWSNVSPLERTSENMVEELRTMLNNVGVQGPYILVGHSFGGLNVQLFAAKYPNEVAGVILVDANSEDGWEKFQKGAMNAALAQIGMIITYLGIPRLVQNIPSIKILADKNIQKYDAKIQEVYWSQKLGVKHAAINIQECACLEQNSNQLKQAGTSLGNKPLIVISASKPLLGEELKVLFAPEVMEKANLGWREVQAGLPSKSSHSKHIIAEDCGHQVPYEQPEIIVEAVREMYEELRK